MTYTIWNYDAGAAVKRGARYPRPGHSDSVRRDPTNLVPNCPPDLKGQNGERLGWLREIEVRETLAPWQKHGSPSYGEPDMSTGTVTVSIPAVDMSLEEVLERKLALVDLEFQRRVDAGHVINGVRFGLTDKAFTTLELGGQEADANGSFMAETSHGDVVTITGTSQTNPIVASLRHVYRNLAEGQASLKQSMRSAADLTTLKAIDETQDSHWT